MPPQWLMWLNKMTPEVKNTKLLAGKAHFFGACLGALAATILVPAVTPSWGQDWAKAMFDHLSYDFGTVARGAKVEHRFIIENIYEEDVHIQSISSTCGCSTAEVGKQTLKTWEKTALVVTLDTRGFLGRKDATITVVFDAPFYAEVQLNIYSYIRRDVVVQPGAVEFGAVPQGVETTRTLKITYAGRSDWRLERVECSNPHLEVQLSEIQRTAGPVANIAYELLVKLKSGTPPGYIKDQLVLVTNDANARAARVPVSVEGVVRAALSVRPTALLMGVAEPGQPLTRNIVVQGQTPFRILAVHCNDERFQCRLPAEAKTIHILPVTFLAKQADKTGIVKTKLRIETDLSGRATVEVEAAVQIGAAPATGP